MMKYDTEKKIQALFDVVDFLDDNKKEYIETYVPLCARLKNLHIQLNQLRPHDNFKEKQKYEDLQKVIKEEFAPVISNVYIPISNKLRELGIWSGDATYASIWNNNYPAISDYKEKFASEDIAKVIHSKNKYLSFRRETDTDFLCLTFAFSSLDEILKALFDFFKDTQENEFEEFEAKTIIVNNFKEIANGLVENTGKNVKFSIPFTTLDYEHIEKESRSTNMVSEIIMGDKIQVGNISNNNGPISVGKRNTAKVNGNDEFSKKTFHWQKWGIITATILALVAIIVTVIMS